METENPFAQQTFQPEPMFTDDQKATIPPADPSPKRKSRRSRRTAAAPSPASPAPAKAGKRKYTRRAKPSGDSGDLPEMTPPEFRKPKQPELLGGPIADDLEFVTSVVASLRGMDAKRRARVMTAVGKLL